MDRKPKPHSRLRPGGRVTGLAGWPTKEFHFVSAPCVSSQHKALRTGTKGATEAILLDLHVDRYTRTCAEKLWQFRKWQIWRGTWEPQGSGGGVGES